MQRQSPLDMLVKNAARRLAGPRTRASLGAFPSSLSPVDDEPAIFIRCPDLKHRQPRCKGTSGGGSARADHGTVTDRGQSVLSNGGYLSEKEETGRARPRSHQQTGTEKCRSE